MANINFVFDSHPQQQIIIEVSLLSNNIHDYNIVAQGKTSIPGVDDGEEFTLTDVRLRQLLSLLLIYQYYFKCDFV